MGCRTVTLSMTGNGLIVLAPLALVCAVCLRLTRDRRLVTVLFWLAVWGIVWVGFSIPVFHRPPAEPVLRSGGTLLLVAGLSTLLCGFVAAEGVGIRRSRRRAMFVDPDRLLTGHESWPAFRKSAGAVCVLLLLLTGYELASAASVGVVSGRLRALVLSLSGAAAAAAMFALTARRWSVNLAELAMGLATLGAASTALLLVPSAPQSAEERFPMVFNALMAGLALMAGFWVWIGRVWAQQLDNGRAWTSAGRISKLSAGFAFFVACLALINGSLIAAWPRLGPIGVFDDSLGRMAASVAGHLLLLLVVLWCGRTTGRLSFGVLAVLVGFSLVLLILTRAKPLASTVHRGPVAAGGIPLTLGAHRT